ncbi:amino acid adenylation domain-containing protein [Anabaena sp. CCY 9910]|uniref:amino acid adenylation domain-containing protein n=1 Tax=Anabaena sp. CCY 9910 TaxID=3103870 RepID=UPI0039E12359
MKTLDELLSELRQRNVQLWLEGDRLRYRVAKDSLTPELLTELKSQKAEIIDFLRRITTVASSQIPPIVSCERNGSLPLSFGQQRLWFLHQFEPDSSSNNMPVVVRFTGNLNVTILEESINEVVRRHEVLRTTFPAVNGKATLLIAPDISLQLPIIDLQSVSDEEREAEAYRLATNEAHRPFDLANGPILRVLLLRLSEQEHLLIWNMHCIVCDGASSDVFYQDLTTIYKALAEGKASPLSPLPLQYADFAHWQHQWLQGEVLESQVNYWKQKLEGSLPIIQLPYDRPRPAGAQTYRGDRSALLLPKSLNYALTELSQKWGVTLFMTLLTVFELLLYRYSGQEDLLISFASAGRGQVETERLIGFFSNTLVLRSDLAGNPTFRQLLGRVRKDCLEAYAHQDLPFERLIEELRPEQRNRGTSSLFQVKFSLNPPWSNGRGMASVELPDLKITSLFGYIYHGKTKYDLTLVLREQDNGLGMVFDYNADMFESSTIERMLGHFQNLLEGIVANPDCPISELTLLTQPEQHQLLVEWNHRQTADIKDVCIHQLFEAQVQRTPHNIAVIEHNQQLTYQELNERANQLAHYLQTLGVGAGICVGLYLEPSLEMIVGLLGICKAGGTYIPITPTSHQDALAFILNDAHVSLLLTKKSWSEKLPECESSIICLDSDEEAIAPHSRQNLVTQVTSGNLACVIYTLNPINKPDGIAMSHSNLVNHAVAIHQLWEVSAGDRILVFSGISSDTTIESLFPCWMNGASAVIQPQTTQNSITNFFSFIAQQQITVLNLPTFFWYKILRKISNSQAPLLESLRLVMVGGEKVSRTAYESWIELVGKQTRWLNAYGSIATTFTATVYDPQTASSETEILIGQPIANTQIYILDQLLQPVPVGAPGEIYISGVGVAKGYFRRTDLTSERFIPHPFSDNTHEQLYKTGDLARYLPDGNIEYLGRTDNQVKICGVCVDLEQIEALLHQHQAITQVVVIATEVTSGEKQLVAYLVTQPEQTPTIDDLQTFLSQKIPHYWIPSDFIFLESLPVNTNGQVNRGALPEPNFIKQKSGANFVAPRNQLEIELTKIWENVLGKHPIGLKDNFFGLGGHSLLALRMFSQIETIFGKNLPLAILFQAPTIQQLSDILQQEGCSTSWSSLVPIQLNGSKPPLFLIHPIGGNVLEYSTLARYLGEEQPIYGLQSLGLDGKQAPLNRVEDMANAYLQEIRSIQPNGPYFIAGYSFGGLVAYEMAQQLYTQGQKIGLLALLDTSCPNLQITRPSLTKFVRVHVNNLWKLQPQEKLIYIRNWLKWYLKNKNTRDVLIQDWQEVLENSHIVNVIDANVQAYENYTAQPYAGAMTLFRSSIQPVKLSDNIDLGWHDLVTGGLEIHHLTGDHSRLLKEPHVQKLTEQLQICLERSLTDNTLLSDDLNKFQQRLISHVGTTQTSSQFSINVSK